jgi:pseudouridine kinase
MALTEREQEIVDLLRRDPLITPARIAERLGSTRAAVNVHLSNLGRKGAILGRGYVLGEHPAAVVIGGANVDVKARSGAPAIAGTSNPGSATATAGGVGRNIAENLARLGTLTHLIAAIGHDAYGERLMTETRAAGVHLEHVHRSEHPTGTYTAVLDANGELLVAVSDMTATDDLRSEHLHPARDLIAHAAVLVLDGNLSTATIAYVLDLARAADIRTVVDPVSVPKAVRLIPLISPDRPLYAITPNRDELRALTGRETGTDGDLVAAADALHRRGVRHVWVRLGSRGSLLSTPDENHFLPADAAEVQDVTGAGDAMLAAFAHALLTGRSPVEAARYGHAAAALTLESSHTVRPDLTALLLDQATESIKHTGKAA